MAAARSMLVPVLPLGGTRWPAMRWIVAGMAVTAMAAVGIVAPGLLLGGIAVVLPIAALVAAFAIAAPRGGAAPVIVDWTMLHAAFADGLDATVVTTRDGAPICASPSYEALYGGAIPPLALPLAADDHARLAAAMRVALREGAARVSGLPFRDGRGLALIRCAGRREDHLVWRFRRDGPLSPYRLARELIDGSGGIRLGMAGVMLAMTDAGGAIIAANPVFVHRALGDARDPAGLDFAGLFGTGDDGIVRLTAEGEAGPPIRLIAIPLGDDAATAPSVFLLMDEDPDTLHAAAVLGAATDQLHGLLAMLPLGLALIERDGHFLYMNDAFGRAAGLEPDAAAMYPSDLVVDEDKQMVIETIRRFAAGRALPGDLAIRLRARPDEPAALTIANAKGLGDAAVLLSLKDDTEQSTLKRQVAQATKMQAVGQLAGGVAHDFNNILTAIMGHCDLMLMRHTPGDIDYDDIQQIKHNSNRAAALTRQLLAFSRQQTLRPQVLQLPDVVSEVTNLLRRLLGETVRLEVKHGRSLGFVRADPGQLEQVIVNLAVNARDAMPDGGTLLLQTLSVPAAEVRRMRSDILAVADYTALRVSDTGVGIPTEYLAKIFEPFFTTKEVGKGTGLGLSTVYGIVKQTDGFIFAESVVGQGTSFMIYLPVVEAAALPAPAAPVRVEPAGELWGTGTILLVEDEATVRAVAERALVRQGYSVLTADNGEEALGLLEERGPVDLLISDVVMPTMDGPTLVRAARALYPDLPILFMSGYAEEQLRQSLDLEHVAFLSKPFSVQQLAHAARDVLAGLESAHGIKKPLGTGLAAP